MPPASESGSRSSPPTLRPWRMRAISTASTCVAALNSVSGCRMARRITSRAAATASAQRSVAAADMAGSGMRDKIVNW
jgi:hypothetical protein